MEEVIVTDANFDEEVLKAKLPVLVDFWAVWCGPCRIQGPIVEELARSAGSAYKICKLDVDTNPAVAQRFSIMSIPTLMIFKDGKVFWQGVGVHQKPELEELLKNAAGGAG